MGFLSDIGQPLSYKQSIELQKLIKNYGIQQFIRLLVRNQKKTISKQSIQWGYEIEAHVISLDDQKRKVKIQPNNKEMFELVDKTKSGYGAHVEFGEWMIELVPTKPIKSISQQKIKKEIMNFNNLNKLLTEKLGNQQSLSMLTVFPTLGVGNYYRDQKEYDKLPKDKYQLQAYKQKNNKYSQSLYFDDKVINQHARFKTLTQNIRQRRGSPVNVQIPLVQSENVAKDTPNIHMDAMGFGMGACCLQVTFGTENYNLARFLYDQFVPLGAVFMALSAATPILKGKLSAHDTKFSSIEQSVDCRTESEKDNIPKSRYSSVNYYISNNEKNKDYYNDVYSELNYEAMQQLEKGAKENGVTVDRQLVQHIGYLFSRDAMVIFDDTIHDLDPETTRHFEQFNSTNWHSMRFKPPPSLKPDEAIPWRVEFRSMELQPTIEDNLKFSIIIELLSKIICEEKMDINLYIPISLVDENQRRGNLQNAAVEQKFWFRKEVRGHSKDQYIELTAEEWLLGKKWEFIGMRTLFQEYFEIQKEYIKNKVQNRFFQTIEELNDAQSAYCDAFQFMVKRAQGKSLTYAQYLRNFVENHPDYKNDSIITEKMSYDICKQTQKITQGQSRCYLHTKNTKSSKNKPKIHCYNRFQTQWQRWQKKMLEEEYLGHTYNSSNTYNQTDLCKMAN